jgi:hypothetical protein
MRNADATGKIAFVHKNNAICQLTVTARGTKCYFCEHNALII